MAKEEIKNGNGKPQLKGKEYLKELRKLQGNFAICRNG